MAAFFRVPGISLSLHAIVADLAALVIIFLSIFAARRHLRIGADLFLAFYFLVLLVAKAMNYVFASDKQLGPMRGFLSPTQRSASKKFALYIWHPGFAFTFATTLHWLQFAAAVWFAVCLWHGFYVEAIVLSVVFILVLRTITTMYPDLHLVDAADRGKEGAARMLRRLREVQQILEKDHRFAPHIRYSPREGESS